MAESRSAGDNLFEDIDMADFSKALTESNKLTTRWDCGPTDGIYKTLLHEIPLKPKHKFKKWMEFVDAMNCQCMIGITEFSIEIGRVVQVKERPSANISSEKCSGLPRQRVVVAKKDIAIFVESLVSIASVLNNESGNDKENSYTLPLNLRSNGYQSVCTLKPTDKMATFAFQCNMPDTYWFKILTKEEQQERIKDNKDSPLLMVWRDYTLSINTQCFFEQLMPILKTMIPTFLALGDNKDVFAMASKALVLRTKYDFAQCNTILNTWEHDSDNVNAKKLAFTVAKKCGHENVGHFINTFMTNINKFGVMVHIALVDEMGRKFYVQQQQRSPHPKQPASQPDDFLFDQ